MGEYSDEAFEAWWARTGKGLDPDTSEVPWFDKRKYLAAAAFAIGMLAGGNYTCDDSTYPSRVQFANGRVVQIQQDGDETYLGIGSVK